MVVNSTLGLLRCARIANDFANVREQALYEYLSIHTDVCSLMKLAGDRKWINAGLYTRAMVIIENVERQAQGWLRSCAKGRTEGVTSGESLDN